MNHSASPSPVSTSRTTPPDLQPAATHRGVLWVLAAGFAVTILLLLSAAWVSKQVVETIESRSEALLDQHRATTRVIDQIQGEEASLSDVFYALVAAAPRQADPAELMQRLNQIDTDVRATMQASKKQATAEQWSAATRAIARFVDEVRQVIRTPGTQAPPSLYAAHEAVVNSISALVSVNYQTAIEQDQQGADRNQRSLQQGLLMLILAVVLAAAGAVTTIRITARMFQRQSWQARELARLSRQLMTGQEEMLQRFSRELHDEFGQSLTAIEANLAAVPAATPEVAGRLEDCTLLIQDLMHNVRELSQLLRPSVLDDFGLKPSLHLLAESFAQRNKIEVEDRLEFAGRLHADVETHLFRIAQEALTNVHRHSQASKVRLELVEEGEQVRLSVADNGGGLKSQASRRGLGLAGMRERMKMSHGTLDVDSEAGGVTVIARVPLILRDGAESSAASEAFRTNTAEVRHETGERTEANSRTAG